MLFRSRVVKRASERERGDNVGTVILEGRHLRLAPPCFEDLYRAHYEDLRAAALAFGQPGVAVFAIDRKRDQLVGSMCLAAVSRAIRAGIVGRHSEVDLSLSRDPALALRHLAFVVEPVQSFAAGGGARFAVLDLHTGRAPRDEEGRAVASLTSEGAVFLDCGRYALMAFVTGDESDWPERATDGWACLPERVFVEERLAEGSLGYAPRAVSGWPAARHRTTIVARQGGPLALHGRLVEDGELAAGLLTIANTTDRFELEVGEQALRRGLLIGRYDRCHAGVARIGSPRVSRVHLALVSIAGRVHAIDLGTTNGSFQVFPLGHVERFRQLELDERTRIDLAGSGVEIGWRSL